MNSKMQNLLEYKYYDSPDGTDCFKKLFYTMKMAGTVGMMTGLIDVRFMSHTQGIHNIAAKFAYYTFPFMGIAAAYTATTYIATSLRHKDDRLNHMLGGIAAGSVCGAWKRNMVVGVVTSIGFGLFAVLKKSSKLEGWEFVADPPFNQSAGSLRWARHDYTLTKPPPRQWKKYEDEEI